MRILATCLVTMLMIAQSDCDGEPGNSTDQDGDGFSDVVDCDDTDPSINPGAEEVPYDGIDQDCNGSDLTDVDGDGFGVSVDCDDTDASIFPGADEIPNDGIDQDCDGSDAGGDAQWSCDPTWYGGDYCDCGCGILDPQCTSGSVDACEYNSCPTGYWPDEGANWLCHPIECGNAYVDPGEACDDGNTTDGDGCSSVCEIEYACGPTTAIRIMAANLTSGNDQSYDPGHGQRIMQGLEPDVVLIQEFSYGNDSDAAIRGFVDDTFGSGFYYYREPANQIPNGIISRWPIRESGYWEDTRVSNREFAYARIDLPGAYDLWAISVHFLTTSSGDRSSEANQLVDYIQANVPDSDFIVIGGDLNVNSRGENAVDTLTEVVSVAYTPVDRKGNSDTNQSRSKPYDWVMPDRDLEVFHTAVRIGSNEYPNGLVFDSRVYEPLSDVPPVQYSDSDASNMQHMGVVMDFNVPGCE